MLDRRSVLAGLPMAFVASAASADPDPIADLEQRHGGRLGVAAVDTGSGRTIAHRAGERFAMCSTFKLLLAAAILQRTDSGTEKLGRFVPYGKADLLPHSPFTSAHAWQGRMSIGELCAAVVVESDNTAANLLIATLGGPAGVTHFARSLGDRITRLDRTEMSLNDVPPGDERDTTTPSAMLGDMQSILLGSALSADSRLRLLFWLNHCATGKDRLRAGMPAGWFVGDKTGTGFKTETNDIAIVWPSRRAPILITAYYTGSREGSDGRNAVLADVGRIVASRFS